jgi:hypothetical protein
MSPKDDASRPRGWYRDGTGERWWDGSLWTDRRRSWNGTRWAEQHGEARTDAHSAPPPNVTPEKSSIKDVVQGITGWWYLAKFMVFNILATFFVGFLASALVAYLVGEPPVVIRIVLTLVSVPPAGYFIWYWLRRRRTKRYGMPVIEVRASVLSGWEALDVTALSRHAVFAAIGTAVWSTVTFVGPLPAFIILLVILFMVFPLDLDDEE